MEGHSSLGCDVGGSAPGKGNPITLVAPSCVRPVGDEVKSLSLGRPTAKNTIIAGAPVLVIVAVDCGISVPIPARILSHLVDLVTGLFRHILETNGCMNRCIPWHIHSPCS